MTWYEALTFLMSFTLTLAVIFCLVGFGIWLHDRIVARRARKMSIDIPASNQGAWFYEANEATPIASFTAPSTRFTHVYIEDAFGSLTKSAMKTNEELFDTWRDTFNAKGHLSTEDAVTVWQRAHEYVRTLPDDIQGLLFLKETIDRECTRGIRCGVCGGTNEISHVEC